MATRTTPKGTWCPRKQAPRRAIPVLPNQLPFKMPGAVGVKCSRCSSLSVVTEQPEPSLRARLRARLRHPLRGSTPPASARERAHEAYREHTCTGHRRTEPVAEQTEYEFHDPEVWDMAKAARDTGATMATVYFWVGGNGTFDNATNTNWSLTSGGAGGAGHPTAGDTAVFDSNSGAGAVVTCAATAACGTLTCDASTAGSVGSFTGTLTSSTITFAGAMGSFFLSAGMTFSVTTINVNVGTGTLNIKTAGKTLNGFAMAAGATSATAVFQDAFTCSGTVNLLAGVLNTNGQTCSWGSFTTSGAVARTLTMGSSAITVSGAWTVAVVTGLTVTANTATLTTSSTSAFGTATFNWNGLSVVVTGTGTVNCLLTGVTVTVANFTYAPGSALTTNVLILAAASLTCTGTFTATGSAAPNRVLIQSSVVGTARTITAATVTISTGVDFQDITGAGAGSWNLTTPLSGDCGGNSGITFAAGATQFWVGNGGNWHDTTKWASSSGGVASSGRVPLPQDNVSVDANSITIATQTIAATCPRLGRSVDFTGIRVGATFQLCPTGVSTNTNYGSWTFGTGMLCTIVTGSGTHVLAGRGSFTITSAGVAWPFTANTTINAPGGTYVPVDHLLRLFTSSNNLTISSGTLDNSVNNQSVDGNVTVSSGASILMGSGTFTFYITMAFQPGSTVTCGTSTMVCVANRYGVDAVTFTGGGHTFHGLQITNPGIVLTLSGATNNSFDSISCVPSSKLVFASSTTTTITAAAGLQINGTPRGYEYLPGVTGNYCSTPDAAPLHITGDIDLRCRVAMDTWTPAAASAFLGRWTVAPQLSFLFWMNTNGRPQLSLSTTGTAIVTSAATAATGLANGTLAWVRATWQQSTGTVTFYTASGAILNPAPGDWTQLGTTVASGLTSALNAGTSILEIGTDNTGASAFTAGKFYRAQVYNGIAGTVVFDADFMQKPFGANTLTEGSTNAATVSINGVAAQLGDGRAVINSSTAGTAATISVASGTVSCTGLSLKDQIATGGATFLAVRSSIVSNVTGWTLVVLGGSDTSTATDVATSGVVLARTSSDSAVGTDVATRGAAYSRVGADRANSTDAASSAVRLTPTAADSALTSGVATSGIVGQRTATDSSVASDGVSGSISLSKASADTSLATDVAVGASVRSRSASDTAVDTDVATARVIRTRSATDASLATDVVRPHTQPARATDTALAVDEVHPRLQFKTASDTALALDSGTSTLKSFAFDAAISHDVATLAVTVVAMATQAFALVECPTSFANILPVPTPAPGPTGSHQYEVIVVDSFGIAMGQIPSAVVGQIDWDLNDVGQATIDFWILDPNLGSGIIPTAPGQPTSNALFPPNQIPGGREIQIWRDETLVWWGWPTGATTDASQVHLQCSGLLWPYGKRFFGPTPSNLLINGGFETGDLTGWTPINFTPGSSTIEVGGFGPKLVLQGSSSCFMSFAGAFTDTYIQQFVPFDTTGKPAATFDLSGWVYLLSTSNDPVTTSAATFGNRGLFMQAIVDITVQDGSPQVGEVTASTPYNRWTRVDCQVIVPPNSSGVIEIRAYAGIVITPGFQGVVWDALTLTENLGVGMTPDLSPPDSTQIDVFEIIQNILTYAQDPYWGKTYLNMGFGGANTGTVMQRVYALSDNGSIMDALNEFPSIGICDFEVIWDPSGHWRSFIVWPGAKGQINYNAPLALDMGNVTDLQGAVDGTRVGTGQRVLGQGSSGSSLDIGSAIFPSYLGGRVTEGTGSTGFGFLVATSVPFFEADDLGRPIYSLPPESSFFQPIAASNAPPPIIPFGAVITQVISATEVIFSTQLGGGGRPAMSATGLTIGVGGVLVEQSVSAIPDLPITTLQGTANNSLIAQLGGQVIPSPKMRADGPAGMFGKVSVGDVIPVAINYGWVQIPGVLMRIIGMSLYPPTEEFQLTLNPINATT